MYQYTFADIGMGKSWQKCTIWSGNTFHFQDNMCCGCQNPGHYVPPCVKNQQDYMPVENDRIALPPLNIIHTTLYDMKGEKL